MANILYGINGEGSGHWTRSKEVITHLQEAGHKVTIVTSGRALTNLKGQFDVEEIYGLSFKYVKGKVDEFRSFLKNIDAFPKGALSLKKVSNLIKKNNINLVVTDFEPISSLASNIRGIPSISIDNQHFITNTDAAYPPKSRIQAELTRAGIDMMVSAAEAYVTISFFDAKPNNDKTFILPPILRKEVFDLKSSDGDYILAYLTYRSSKIKDILKNADYKFIFYGADEESHEGNVTFKKFDPVKFLEDLAGAGGVLATAGFSLISEALYLRKPYFALPVKHQFEQTFNAYHLERLGYGRFDEDLTEDGIKLFLSNQDKYKKNLASYPRQDNSKLFNAVDELVGKFT